MDKYSTALHAAAVAAVPGWVERSVARRAGVRANELADRATEAGVAAAAEVDRALRTLLETDIDEQRTNPLSILRSAVRFPSAVLAEAGIAPVGRDSFVTRAFPTDVYDLAPATWRDVDESLLEPGIEWGAWKAKQHLDRRRR